MTGATCGAGNPYPSGTPDFTSGVLVERFMHCPVCDKPSFLGEWNSPKETQSMETKPCELCHADVDTSYLVQRREKTRDNVLENIAKVRLNRKRAITQGVSLVQMLDDQQKELDDDIALATAARPIEGRRRGGVLPLPDLSAFQSLPQISLPVDITEDDIDNEETEQKEIANAEIPDVNITDDSNVPLVQYNANDDTKEEDEDADDEIDEEEAQRYIARRRNVKTDGSTQT